MVLWQGCLTGCKERQCIPWIVQYQVLEVLIVTDPVCHGITRCLLICNDRENAGRRAMAKRLRSSEKITIYKLVFMFASM